MKPTRIPSRMRKNTPDRIVRIPIFYIFASISWAFGSQWCSQERKNPGIIRMSGFLCYLKAAILHTAAMLAHGIAGRSNPMGSVRHTNHQKETIRMDGFFFVFSEHYGSLDYGAFSIILSPRTSEQFLPTLCQFQHSSIAKKCRRLFAIGILLIQSDDDLLAASGI